MVDDGEARVNYHGLKLRVYSLVILVSSIIFHIHYMKNNTVCIFFITDMVAMVTKLLNHRWLGCMPHCG